MDRQGKKGWLNAASGCSFVCGGGTQVVGFPISCPSHHHMMPSNLPPPLLPLAVRHGVIIADLLLVPQRRAKENLPY